MTFITVQKLRDLPFTVSNTSSYKLNNVKEHMFVVILFHRLGLECLKEAIADKYHKILLQFGRDIENIQKTYQRLRHEPPIARDLPPIAGKIMWARQMFRRIQEPMEHLKKYPEILQGDDSKRIVRNYNKVATVLLQFEVLYHQAWMKQVGGENFHKRFASSLLVPIR